ncbi:hypothetical protein QBC33DRAFT_562945 [Phialemonium atrogriseum]|uniref:Neuroparsin n=1 Tax=Phialemonium atrogriseum TaxID=1093897 RepID=A0AAJ0BSE0_9PEZI|nr:uncharacterized protein QBC33DRAFT_562945 [Phialemonium atrogriseum]KAK1763396.1 hypothetical protein QBC33DRAFT_562945 [Phialemonium atrogriseum]
MKFTIITIIAITVTLATFGSATVIEGRQQSCGDCEQQVMSGNTDACNWGICQGCGLC